MTNLMYEPAEVVVPAEAIAARLIEENVITQLDHLVTYPCVAAKMRSGNLFVHGLIFDIKTGTFKILDRTTHQFLPLKTALNRRAAHEHVEV